MINATINATAQKGEKTERSITLKKDLPATLPEMVKVWGENVVFEMAKDTFVIRLQARARGMLALTGDDRMNDAAIQKDIAEYKPGIGRKAADPAKKAEGIKKAFASMSDADKKALLAALRGSP